MLKVGGSNESCQYYYYYYGYFYYNNYKLVVTVLTNYCPYALKNQDWIYINKLFLMYLLI